MGDAEGIMDLDSWQARLAKHFSQLREDRNATWGDKPIFALEHGLEPAEVQALSAAVRAHIAHTAPDIDHALAWIVYAAEIGYGYCGDEYWQTFEEQTPGWVLLGVCRIGRTEEAKECWSGLRSDYRLHESMLSQIVG